MEQGDFRAFIRFSNGRRLIVPLLFMIFLVVVFYGFSIPNWLFPLRLNNAGEAEEACEQDNHYVYCTVPRMMYAGIDHMEKGRLDGHYYYSLEDGRCQYYLVASERGNAVPVLENYSFNARILKEEEIAKDLDRLMSDMLGWTEEGVNGAANDYILSEIDYNGYNIWTIAVIMAVSFLIAMLHIITLAYNVVNPYDALGFIHFGNGRQRREMILQANDEYNRQVIFMSQGMYVTENFFVYYDKGDFEIIPLDDIVWAYKHSSLRWRIGTRHFITYNVRLVTFYKKTYVFENKTKESCDALLDIIAAQRPEILIGYSQENKVKMNN